MCMHINGYFCMGRSSTWPEQSENPGLLERLLCEDLTPARVHTTSLSSLLETRESDTRSHRENARVKFAPQGGALGLQKDTSFSQQTTQKCSNPGSALCGHAGRGKGVLHRDTQVSPGQMPIPVTYLTCRSQVCT